MLMWCFLLLDSGSAFLEEEYSRSDVFFSVRPARRHLLLISSIIDYADLDHLLEVVSATFSIVRLFVGRCCKVPCGVSRF